MSGTSRDDLPVSRLVLPQIRAGRTRCVMQDSPLTMSHRMRLFGRGMLALLAVCSGNPPSATETVTMPESKTVQVRAANAVLDLHFQYDAERAVLTADYRLRNEGSHAIAVFDRGDSIALAKRKQAAGKNVAPMLVQDGTRVTLDHLALGLPHPAPTVPRVSLAARIDPGETLSGSFRLEMPNDAREVRYCIGVSPFDEVHFTRVETAADDVLWRTAFKVAALQNRLCSPWFSLQDARFESN